jgi:DNA end-binding protein Ku
LPKRAKRSKSQRENERESESGSEHQGAAPARPIWSGTISFGLVSIPVDLFTGVRPRQRSLKMVDKQGHALGRQYHCSADGKELSSDELVRGFETESGDMVVITDEEFESLAPETSTDIELRRFVPSEQIPSIYYDRPYFLAPAGKSSRAYSLLAKTMERTGRIGIGVFVMRSQEYLVAILSDHGVLRAETLRHADEIRSPEMLELPRRVKAPAKKVADIARDIESMHSERLNLSELEDRDAEALQALAESKLQQGKDVIEQAELQDEEPEESGAKVIDFMEVLKKRLSKNAVAKTGEEAVMEEKPKRETHASRSHAAAKSSPAARRAKTPAHAKRARPAKGHATSHRSGRHV